MLIKCPECELQISDKALICPHCGYPIQPDAKPRVPRKSNKRRRLPNGFGQISEIKGRNLRNPFRAMVTVGKTKTGRPICKPLKPESYFPTYNDAYAALVEYNKNPYDLGPAITAKELYEKWTESYFKTLKMTDVHTLSPLPKKLVLTNTQSNIWWVIKSRTSPKRCTRKESLNGSKKK